MAESPEVPTEQTPLVGDAANAKPKISFARGLGIMIPMGCLILIQTTNISMMTTAQSQVAADLDAFAETTWFSAAFMIAVSSVPPLTGRLSQIFMPRSILLVSSIVLSMGLFITAIAPNLAIFLLGRVVSGCGSGGLTSVTIILALDIATPDRRGILIGLISLALTTGLSLGAIIAGALTPTLGWRFIFWIQAPLALISGPCVYLAFPRASTGNGKKEPEDLWTNLARIDYAGAITFTSALTLLLTSLASPEVLIWPIPLSIVLFGLFFVIEGLWAREPIIPLHVFFTRSVLFSALAGTGLMMSRWSVIFYSPIYTMVVREWSPASAGLILIPTNAGFGLGGLLILRRDFHCVHTDHMGACHTLHSRLANTAFYDIHVLEWSHVWGTDELLNFAHAASNPTKHAFYRERDIHHGALERGFAEHGLPPQPDLVRTLLGSPATVMRLEGVKHLVAIQSYEQAIRALFWAGGGLTVLATVLQAGTGWTAPYEEISTEEAETS
ncbi:MFS multidrug transporter [Penicillium chermesinum]|uniref:MFS multidrug transporter n=1 Tax=Penicillium chermesinum TaxID=63820 RepID=A0A9W9TEZ4_9EURO|nr:MFS multidrug transporter [Penicillium chermesinum]KAJ5220382.1 MFS multidrug transporter [Penicillium chermesinum]